MHTASRKLARALGSLLSVALSSLAVKQLHVIISGAIFNPENSKLSLTWGTLQNVILFGIFVATFLAAFFDIIIFSSSSGTKGSTVLLELY